MLPAMIFRDRIDAGEQLAQEIHRTVTKIEAVSNVAPRPIVYALPRGGLPVALSIARILRCPLDIVVAKKISHPKNPELAIGAVTADGSILWDEQTPLRLRNSQQGETALKQALKKANLQLTMLNSGRPQISLKNNFAILVDDGIATGMTMAVAAQALRAQNPSALWICAPVAPLSLLPWLDGWGDRVILLGTPESFLSVSRFYAEFPQVETEEALACLQQQKDWLSEEGVRDEE
jgi:predicted phosphoribosyltransferase